MNLGTLAMHFLKYNKKNNRFNYLWLVSLFLPTFMALSGCTPERLMIFAGAASKPPTEEAVSAFTEKTSIPVDVTFGGSGYMLSQMLLAKRGDIFFPGSSDYMEKAKKEGIIQTESEQIVVYLVPAINVSAGNPKNILSLHDLIRPGLKVAMANPEGVCVGIYAVELIEKNFSEKERKSFRRNVVNYTGNCAQTASAISLNAVDAVLGWRVFQYWDPARIETIPLKVSQIQRIGYIPIAITKYSRNKEVAVQFINFLLSPAGKKIFQKHHYFIDKQDAFSWLGAQKPIGGEYAIDNEWLAP